MTTTQTPADIKLLDLPERLRDRKIQYAMCISINKGIAEAALALDEAIQAYALACVEADRKKQLRDFWRTTESIIKD